MDAAAAENRTVLDAIVIGSGFAGLAMAIRLRRMGLDNFVVLEKAGDVGGTWRDNDYPGCACDIPARLYSYSFERHAGWSRLYPTQPEILAYLHGVAERHDLRRHIRFGAEAIEARYDERRCLWQVATVDGRSFAARFLISGMGGLSRPAFPAIPGRERFAGPAFHSSQWRHDVDLNGRRVAVIGTGASAVQFVPRIASGVARLSVFQRTAPWVLPRRDRRMASGARWLAGNVPGYDATLRAIAYWRQESRVAGFTHPGLMRRLEPLARRFLERQVADPALRARLAPDYAMGCKRVLIADDYYPALQRDNVALVTEAIAEIEPRGLRAIDGVLHEADVLIFGTGFRATDLLTPMRIAGRDGLDLNEAWRDGMAAYCGTAVAGFPNLFLLVGPNTGLGHNSIVFIIEAQLRYIADCLRKAGQAGAIEPRAEAQRLYNEEIQRRLARTVWASGCRSWYLDAQGRNTTLWPGSTVEFWWRTRRAENAAHLVSRPASGI